MSIFNKILNQLNSAVRSETIVTTNNGETPTIELAELLFKADFVREGSDLILKNFGFQDIRIIDYFGTDVPADIHTADGRVLKGEVVAKLAGPEFPGQYAQASGDAGQAEAIGQVESLTGAATVQRADGTREDLAIGTKVFANDVVQTADGGALSLTFVDGTIFTLAESSRMVLDSLIYDPASSDNSGVFNLVEGSFIFIAGQVAKTGGIDVNTPAATMGIRGTTVKIDIVTVNGETIVEVSLNQDPDGTLGEFTITGLDGSVIADINSAATKWIISPVEGETREVFRSADELNNDQAIINRVIDAYNSAQQRVEQGGEYVEQDSNSNDQGPEEDAPEAPPEGQDENPEQQGQQPPAKDGEGQNEGNAPDSGDQSPDGEQRGQLGSGIETDFARDTFEDENGDADVQISSLGGAAPPPAEQSAAGFDPQAEQEPPEPETVTDREPEIVQANSSPTLSLPTQAVVVEEDGAVSLSGFLINDSTSELLTASLTAGSTVTLAPNSGVEILTGTGVDDEFVEIRGTLTQINNALNGAIYRPSGNADDSGTLTVVITDGEFTTSGILSVDILPQQDAPVAVDDAFSIVQGAPDVTGNVLSNDFDLDVSPVPDTLSVTSIRHDGTDFPIIGANLTINLVSGGSFTIATNGAYTLNTGSNYDYLAGGQTTTDIVTYTVSDGQEAQHGQTVTGDLAITVTGVEDPPIISGDGTVDVNEGQSTFITTNDLDVSDVDTAAGSIVFTITTPPAEGQLELLGAPGVAITSFTLTQLAAAEIIYAHNGSLNTSDTFSYDVSDGSTTVSGGISVAIAQFNDDPTGLGLPNLVTITEDTPAPLDLSTFQIADTDDGGAVVSVNLNASNLTLSAGPSAGVTITTTATGLSLEGTIADINGAFSNPALFTISPDADLAGTGVASISVLANDGGNTGTGGGADVALGTISVDINAVNDPISFVGFPSALNVVEDSPVNLDLRTVVISDIDAGSGLVGVFLSGTNGTFTVPGAGTGVTITDISSSISQPAGTNWRFTGTVDDLNAHFSVNGIVTFTPDLNVTGPGSVSLTAQDFGNTGAGGPTSLSQTTSFTITPVNDAPVLAATTSGAVSYTENDPAASLGTTISVSDVDDTQLTGATVSITSNFQNGDELGFTDAMGITGFYAAGVLTLTGNASLANYKTALESITYSSTSENISESPRTLEYTVTDGTANSNAVLATGLITPTAVNDQPVFSGFVSAFNVVEDTSVTLDLSPVTISDADAGSADVSLTISVTGAPAGSLSFAANSSVAISANTITGSVANINAYLDGGNVDFAPAADFNGNTARLAFTVNDLGNSGGAAQSLTGFSDLNIAAVNDAPTISGLPASFSGTEDTPFELDLSTLTLADIDANGGDISLTITPSAGSLNFLASTTVAISGNTITGTIAEITNYLAPVGTVTINPVTYSPPADGNGNFQLEFVVSDNGNTGGAALSVSETRTVAISEVNDIPVLADLALNAVFNEVDVNAGFQAYDSDVTLSDVDSVDFDGGQLAVTYTTTGFTEDQLGLILSATAGVGIERAGNIVSFNGVALGEIGSNGTNGDALIVSFNQAVPATLSAVEALVEAIGYANTSGSPQATREIQFSISDGDGGTVTTAARTITITPQNDAPTLSVAGAPVNYIENTAEGTIDATLTLADADDTQLESATVSITGNFEVGDFLILSASTATALGLSASYVTSTGILTLTGSASLANYKTALESVTYASSSNDISELPRTISFQVNDGDANSNVGTAVVNPVAVNDAPVISNVPTSFTGFTEDTPGILNLNGLTLSDPDVGSNELQFKITSSGGSVSFASGAGITSVDADTISGTAAALNTYLSGGNVTFTPDANATGSISVQFELADNGEFGTGGAQTTIETSSITVAPTNDAPVLATTGGTTAYTENDPATTIATTLTLTDVDDTSLESATVSITANFQPGDTLAFTDMLGITGSYAAGTGILTLTGTASLADYKTALESVAYFSTSDDLSDLLRTISYQVNDGDANSNIGNATVNPTSVNDAPTFSGTPISLTIVEDTTTFLDFSGVTIADVDAGNADVSLDFGVPVTSGTIVLAPSAGITISGSTIVGSVAAINAYLAGGTTSNISFIPAMNATAGFIIELGLNDLGNSGSGSTVGVLANANVTVTAVNDAPTITGVPTSFTGFVEDTPAALDLSGLTLDDPDSGGANVRLSITPASGSVSFAAQAGIVVGAGYVEGSIADLNTYLNATNVTFTPGMDVNGSVSIQFTLDDLGATGAGGAMQTSESSSIVIAGVNDAPTITDLAASVNFGENAVNAAVQAIDTALSVSDVDSVDFAGGSLSIEYDTPGLAEDQLVFLESTTAGVGVEVTAGIVSIDGTVIGTVTSNGQNGNGLIVSFDQAGVPSPSAVELLLEALGYQNTSNTPTASRTINVSLSDGDGGTVIESTTITVTPENDNPSIVIPPGPGPDFTEGDGPTAILSQAIVDPDGDNLASATVQFTTGTYQNGEDVLTFTPVGNITGSFDAPSGTLTLTGVDTVANYNTALTSVRYVNNSENPNETDRTVQWSVTDTGGLSSNFGTATRTFTVTAVNDAPNVTAVSSLDLDAIVVNDDNSSAQGANATQILTNNGSGILTAATTGTPNTRSTDVKLVDIDRDGDLDAVVGNEINQLLTNQGGLQGGTEGTFIASDLPGGIDATQGIAVGDIDNDGDVDIISANWVGSNSEVIVNQGGAQGGIEGTFVASDLPSANTGGPSGFRQSRDVDLADVDGDGDLDFILANDGSANQLYLNTGGTFTASNLDAVASVNSQSVEFGDVDGDGDLDAVIGVYGAANEILINNGTGGFTVQTFGTVGDVRNTNQVSLGDLDGDGDLDALIANATGQDSQVAFNQGGTQGGVEGTYAVSDIIGATGKARNVVLADIDNDGDLDAVITNNDFSASAQDNQLLTNDGSGNFTVTTLPGGGNATNAIAFGDIDGDGLSYTEDTPFTLAGITITDVDAADLTVTLTATNGTLDFIGGADLSNLTTNTGGGTGVLSFTGPIADIQTLVGSSIEFTPDANYFGPAQVQVLVNDQGQSGGAAQQASGILDLIIDPVNDLPTVTGLSSGETYTESQVNSGFQIFDPDVTVIDVDSDDFSGGSLSSFYVGAGLPEDQLGIVSSTTAGAGIEVSGSNVTFDGTLIGVITSDGTNGSALTIDFNQAGHPSKAATEALIESIGYSNTSSSPTATRSLQASLSDGDGGIQTSFARTITITPENDAPTLSSAGGPAAYSENDPATTIGATLTIADADDTQLESATVSISANFQTGDLLELQTSIATSLGLTASYAPTTGVLTITGSAALASYKTALEAVTYRSSSEVISELPRTISYQVNDGDDNSGVGTVIVNPTAQNDAPVFAGVPAGITVGEDATANLDLSGISVTDVDAGSNDVTLTFSSTSAGTFSFASVTGVVVSGTSITGSLADLNTYLADTDGTASSNITFTPAANESGGFNLQITADDLGNTGGSAQTTIANIALTITPENDAPVLASSGGTTAYTENDPATTIATTLTLTDVDDTNIESARVSITNNFQAGDVLGFSNMLGITGSYAPGTGILTLTGTSSLANYKTALESITFVNSSDNISDLLRTISYQVNDGDTNSNEVTAIVNPTSVNDAPVIMGVPTNFTNITEGMAGPLDLSGLVLSDPDAGTATVRLTITATNGIVSFTDALAVNVGTGFVEGNIASINTYLNATNVIYNPLSATGADSITFTLNDLGNSGSGTAQSATVNSTVDIQPANEAPTIDLAGVMASEELIVNGGFERGPDMPISQLVTAGDTSITGWTVVSGNVDHIQDPTGSSTFASAEGDNHIDLHGNVAGVISQTIATEVGKTYELSFQLAGDPANGETIKNVQVNIGGVNYNFSNDTTGDTRPNPGYELQTQTFIATSASTAITFTSLDMNSNSGPGLDAISVRVQETVGATVVANEDVPIQISNIVVGDDDTMGDMTVTLTAGFGSLTVNESVSGGLASGDISGNGTYSVTLTGTVAEINNTLTAFDGLTYQGNLNFRTVGGNTDSITVFIDDNDAGGNQTATATITVDVQAVSDAPPATAHIDDVVEGNISTLNGIQFVGDDFDEIGSDISNIGDINNDGIDDFVIGGSRVTADGASAPTASGNPTHSGSAYVIYGQAGVNPYAAFTNSSGEISLDAFVAAGNGFELVGGRAGALAGISVDGGGDINNDGIDDIVVGASSAGSPSNSGSTYVIYGGQNFNTLADSFGEISLNTVGTTASGALEGFEFRNTAITNGGNGYSVSITGDYNNDGIADLLVGNRTSGVGADEGSAWVIFGGQDFASAAGSTTGVIDFSQIPATIDGFQLVGENNLDLAGASVDNIGDFNNDGIDDFVVGASGNDGSQSNAGAAYVIFGGQDWSSLTTGPDNRLIDLSTIGSTTAGFKIEGDAIDKFIGSSVSSAGDVNNDGIADLFVSTGQFTTLPGSVSYLIYGGQSITGTVNVSAIGSTISGAAFIADTASVSTPHATAVGDLNGDGEYDILIGTTGTADVPNSQFQVGAVSVIYGQQGSSFSGTYNISDVGTTIDGFQLTGNSQDDRLGHRVEYVGDVNSDGYGDFVATSFEHDDGGSNSGSAYLIYGGDYDNEVNLVAGSDPLSGSTGTNFILGTSGDDQISTGGGGDRISSGAGDDRITVNDGAIPGLLTAVDYVDAGSGIDTLVLGDAGNFDFTNVPDLRLLSIEAIDATNSEANTITLGITDVFNLSEDENTDLEAMLAPLLPAGQENLNNSLIVDTDGSSTDTINLENGSAGGIWTLNTSLSSASQTNGYDIYQYVEGGSAEVLATLALDDEAVVNVT